MNSMARSKHMMDLFNALNEENQLITIANTYQLLKEQEAEASRAESIKKGRSILADLERLEKLKVVK